jgi:hypothetical protein
MIYQGSCHCGKIAFEVEGEIGGVADCNCSICQRKGSLMWFVPRSQLRLLTPDSNAKRYTFNQHKIQHLFCPDCGIHPYGEANDPNGNAMAAVNIRCLADVDINAFDVHHYDGRAL